MPFGTILDGERGDSSIMMTVNKEQTVAHKFKYCVLQVGCTQTLRKGGAHTHRSECFS